MDWFMIPLVISVPSVRIGNINILDLITCKGMFLRLVVLLGALVVLLELGLIGFTIDMFAFIIWIKIKMTHFFVRFCRSVQTVEIADVGDGLTHNNAIYEEGKECVKIGRTRNKEGEEVQKEEEHEIVRACMAWNKRTTYQFLWVGSIYLCKYTTTTITRFYRVGGSRSRGGCLEGIGRTVSIWDFVWYWDFFWLPGLRIERMRAWPGVEGKFGKRIYWRYQGDGAKGVLRFF